MFTLQKIVSAATVAVGLASAAPAYHRYQTRSLDGSDNLIAWWGQGTHNLQDLCDDGSFSIVMVSFFTHHSPPALNLASHGGSASAAQKAAGFGDLIDATVQHDGEPMSLADQIDYCQNQKNVKVMISFGGDSSVSDATFGSASEATKAASTIWDLFLGGNVTSSVRPFGTKVKLDGVDFDNESGDGSYYLDFVKKLRSLFATDSSRQYLISGDPQCPSTDGSDPTKANIPDEILPYMDWINVQFYNNQACMIGSDGFKESVQTWSDKCKEASDSLKFTVAVPSSDKAATGDNVGVLSAEDLENNIEDVVNMALPNLGGVTMWDGGWAIDNGNIEDSAADGLN